MPRARPPLDYDCRRRCDPSPATSRCWLGGFDRRRLKAWRLGA